VTACPTKASSLASSMGPVLIGSVLTGPVFVVVMS
jgi:hypothetical protein